MISIIIPVYNGMKYFPLKIEQPINSGHNYEVIIVDDGSTDGSGEYLDSFYSHYDFVKIYHKHNGGIVSARNYGMERAKGDFLFFMDQDDHFIPEVIETAEYQCNLYACDIAFFSTKAEARGIVYDCDIVKRNAVVERTEIKDNIIPSVTLKQENDYAIRMCHLWGALFRRSVIYNFKISFKSFVGYEDDYLFLLDTLLEANRICFIARTGYYWTREHHSTSSSLTYVPDIWNKFVSLYSYVYFRCAEHGIILPEEMKTYIYQSMSIHSLENCSSIINPTRKKDMKTLRKNIRSVEVRDAFNKKSVRSYSGRSRRLFILIQKKKYIAAECYAFLDSIYQYIKHMI